MRSDALAQDLQNISACSDGPRTLGPGGLERGRGGNLALGLVEERLVSTSILAGEW